jgi:hypothetical protein
MDSQLTFGKLTIGVALVGALTMVGCGGPTEVPPSPTKAAAVETASRKDGKAGGAAPGLNPNYRGSAAGD